MFKVTETFNHLCEIALELEEELDVRVGDLTKEEDGAVYSPKVGLWDDECIGESFGVDYRIHVSRNPVFNERRQDILDRNLFTISPNFISPTICSFF